MSTFFTLASGAPELPDDEALAAAAEEARRAREEEEAAAAAADDSDGGYGGGGLLGAAQAVLDAATAHDSDRGGSDTAGEDDDEPRARSPPPEYDAYDEPPRGRRGGRRAPREAREAQLSDGEFESVAVAVMKTLSARGGLASRELLDVASDALPAEAAPEPFVALVEVLRLLVRTRFVIRDRNDPSEPPLVRLASPFADAASPPLLTLPRSAAVLAIEQRRGLLPPLRRQRRPRARPRRRDLARQEYHLRHEARRLRRRRRRRRQPAQTRGQRRRARGQASGLRTVGARPLPYQEAEG